MRARSVVLLLTVAVASAAFAEVAEDGWNPVPVTIKKLGSCSGAVTLVEVDTGTTLASCGITCNETTVKIPAGTWVRIGSRAVAGCGNGVPQVEGPAFVKPDARIGRHPGGPVFRVSDEGNVVRASFAWRPVFFATPLPGGHVK